MSEKKYTDRGFQIFHQGVDRYGMAFDVVESSLANERCVWIHPKPAPGGLGSIHLTPSKARALAAALLAFADEHTK